MDADEFLGELRDAAMECGMGRVAAATGMSRTSLYKMFRPGAKPRLASVLKVMSAVDWSFRLMREEVR